MKSFKSSAVAAAVAMSLGGIGRNTQVAEDVEAAGVYIATCVGPREEVRDEYVALRDEMLAFVAAGDAIQAAMLRAKMEPMEEVKWTDTYKNLVTTVGKNFALDTVLGGSAYTAAWYLGLIGVTGYTAVAVTDTMASHAGWTESVVYSNATRIAPSFSAAAAGSKATSTPAAFLINATDTIKGSFLNTIATKSGTTGTLYSAGLFTGGDKAVANGDTLNVTYTASL